MVACIQVGGSRWGGGGVVAWGGSRQAQVAGRGKERQGTEERKEEMLQAHA